MGLHDYIPPIEETELARNRSGNWELRWSVPASETGTGHARSRSRSLHTTDYNLAVKIRREFLASAAAAVRSLTVPTVERLCALYEQQHIDAHGIAPSQSDSLKAIRRELGQLEAANLTAGDFARYKTNRLTGVGGHRKVKSGTVRRELGALRAVLNWAQREGHISRDIHLPHIALPPEGQARQNYLTAKNEARVHDMCVQILVAEGSETGAGRAALFALIALNQAARTEAIETLDWSRVDFARRLIDFNDPERRRTRKRRVVSPIADRLLPILQREWEAQGKPSIGPVLRHTGSTRYGFYRLREMCGPVMAGVTRHDLRRTWATLAAQAGVSMHDIADVLGDTLETTEKHYRVFAPDYLRRAINTRDSAAA